MQRHVQADSIYRIIWVGAPEDLDARLWLSATGGMVYRISFSALSGVEGLRQEPMRNKIEV